MGLLEMRGPGKNIRGPAKILITVYNYEDSTMSFMIFFANLPGVKVSFAGESRDSWAHIAANWQLPSFCGFRCITVPLLKKELYTDDTVESVSEPSAVDITPNFN